MPDPACNGLGGAAHPCARARTRACTGCFVSADVPQAHELLILERSTQERPISTLSRMASASGTRTATE